MQSISQPKVTHARSAEIEGVSEIKAAAATTEQTDREIPKRITQVEALTNIVNSLQQAKEKEQQCQCIANAPEKRRRPGCPHCIKQGKEQTCCHCFFCGKEVHRAVGCLNRQKSQHPPSGQRVHCRQQSPIQSCPDVTIQLMLGHGITWVGRQGNHRQDNLRTQEKRLSSLLERSVYWKDKLEVIN